jgi:ComF family protein
MSILDLIYPKRCVGCGAYGAYLCAACFAYITFADQGFCAVCQRGAIGGFTHPACKTSYEIDGVFASVAYKGVVKRLVYQFKYNPYILDIRHLLVDLFYEGIIQKEPFVNLLTGRSVFTPIPLHKNRMQQRGYNQSQVLSEGLVGRLQKERLVRGDKSENSLVIIDFLERMKQTKPQFGLSQQARLANIAGAFGLKANIAEDLRNTPVVFLVDDIVTTGSTLREAARVLKKAGAGKVYGLAFAHG